MRLLNIPLTEKTYSFIFLRQILSCYNLKISFSKLVKVPVLVLELFYGTRTRVHFSISVLVLVLEVFCGTRTRTRKLSTRLHHWRYLYQKCSGASSAAGEQRRCAHHWRYLQEQLRPNYGVTKKQNTKKQYFYFTTFITISLQQFLRSWLNIPQR